MGAQRSRTESQSPYHTRPGLNEAEEISKAMDIRDEMRMNARAMRRRAEKSEMTEQ